jgi:general L-amino acid transport system substrate-binding protein
MTGRRLLGIALTVMAVTLAACDSNVAPSPTPTPAASQGAAGERLAAVQERGQLICGVNGGLPGFSFLDEAANTWSGFDTDFCRAIAAAVLGDAEAVEFRALSTDDRGPAIQTGEVDVLIRNTTWTVSRDTAWGLFAPTTFYDGQGIMVNSTRTEAASLDDLAGATICVQSGTTTELNLADQMRARGIEYEPLVFAEIDPTYEAYDQGRCDAVTSDRSQLVARRSAFATPDEHLLLEDVLSKEPLGPVAPLGDEQWFNVVKWTVFATIQAEELGITSDNVAEMRDASEDPVVARLLGQETPELAEGLGLEADWIVGVIESVGNYGQIFDRNLGPETPLNIDRGLNRLWTDGGLMYAPPYR